MSLLFTGDLTEARAKLAGIVNPSTAPSLSDDDLDEALTSSRIRDSAGLWVGDVGYVTTYNLYWAAAECADLRAIRTLGDSSVNRFSSEGSTFELEPVNWTKVAQQFRWKAAASTDANMRVFQIDREVPQVSTALFPWFEGIITNAD